MELEFLRLLETVYRIYGLEASGIIKEAQEEISAASQVSSNQAQTAQQSLFDFTSDEEIVPQNSIFTTISTTSHLYQLIDSKKGRKILLRNILKQKEVTFDTETTSLDALEAELVGI